MLRDQRRLDQSVPESRDPLTQHGHASTAFGEESFDEVDADDSGAIDENEINDYSEKNWGGAPGGGDDDGPLWGLLDVNDDAEVTEDEWFSEDTFAELDDDESGALDDDEFGV